MDTKDGYIFEGWRFENISGIHTILTDELLTKLAKLGSISAIPVFTKINGGEDGTQTYYTITSAAGSGGRINATGEISVLEGNSIEFIFTPDNGYEVDDVIVNGNSIGNINHYIFSNVKSNHSIYVTFKAKETNTHKNPQTSVNLTNG